MKSLSKTGSFEKKKPQKTQKNTQNPKKKAHKIFCIFVQFEFIPDYAMTNVQLNLSSWVPQFSLWFLLT